MESSTLSFVNRKWWFCMLASFFGFAFLSSFLVNQRWYISDSVLASVVAMEPPPNVKARSLLPSQRSIGEDEEKLRPRSELPPYRGVEATATPPSSEMPPSPSVTSFKKEEVVKMMDGECDIFHGRWVYDPMTYPLYEGGKCPFLSDQVRCRKNGRLDSAYEHWRWEPKGCNLPRFNGSDMLERLRGKRVVVVGDSLNRNQWESLACLLYSATRPSRTYVKLRNDYKIFRAKDYNCTVEFFWSPFLVSLEEAGGGDKTMMLKLDKLSESSKRWRGADVMVFNTGHWWTHRGRLRKWNYYEHHGKQVEEMEGDTAFEVALKTWAHWIDQNVDPTKTTVFFRSISPEHKGGKQQWCYNQTHPTTNEAYVQWFPSSMISIAEKMMNKMKTPVKYLNITKLSEYRREAHTSVYTTRRAKILTADERKQPQLYADCSHWCLPGLPDTWNVLMYASISEIPLTSL